MDSSPEELKIPILDDDLPASPKIENRNRSTWGYIGLAASIAIVIGMFIWVFLVFVARDEKEMKLHKQPEIQLNSLLVCQTIRESVIWDFKFDVVNPYNDSDLCIFGGFDVSVFPYNQTKLLTKAVVAPTTCVGPRNHTSLIAFVEEASSSIQDLNDYLDPMRGTVRLDLKIHSDDDDGYSDVVSYYEDVGYDLVCGDAKVALSANSSASSCGSMVGDPFTCSYTRTTSWDHFWRLFVMGGLMVLFCVFMVTVVLSSPI